MSSTLSTPGESMAAAVSFAPRLYPPLPKNLHHPFFSLCLISACWVNLPKHWSSDRLLCCLQTRGGVDAPSEEAPLPMSIHIYTASDGCTHMAAGDNRKASHARAKAGACIKRTALGRTHISPSCSPGPRVWVRACVCVIQCYSACATLFPLLLCL